ncbi:MAG TPA: bifunctional UDP-N-acetylglucosamine diphosphorylase/glucosamine-1-phosphate N-acetyltransferase GlmU [Steroidobacteraceae bacterium]|jgi:bifunctional UDP-N-acetylglucosamine pyrophosphorylase/glucosamine-1-phosphate N-acetyltransferase
MPRSVVILAAGQGKRMNSDLPKVLQPLAGRPLLEHVIDTARALKPDGLYVVYGHGGSQVQHALHADDIDWVLQDKQLGTGHALMQALPVIPDDHTVLVLYGDVPLIRRETLERLCSGADAGRLEILTVELANPEGYGRIVREQGEVRAIVEHRDANPAERSIKEINTGLMAASAKMLRAWLLDVGSHNAQREYYLTDVVGIAVKSGYKVDGVKVADESEVVGVNDKVQLAQVEAHYRRRRAEELMLAGATIVDPTRIDIRGEVVVGRDVYLDVNTVLEGHVQLGDNVTVGPNCVISDSNIGAHTKVFAHSVIDHAIVGDHCRIGPFARLRPQAVLQSDVHIGNFVEVKNATVGAHSKANHLAYLGDAQVGANVNVGAGSITCNYDGQNKWPTIIDDDVFVGSGSMIVAPVRISRGSTIGAGSTITQTTPEDKLTLERARQTTADKWQRPHKMSEEERSSIIREKTKKV